MFKLIDRKCIQRPILLTSRTDEKSLKHNRKLQYRNAIEMCPITCAFVAQCWKQEIFDKLLILRMCLQWNCVAVHRIIYEFFKCEYYFPNMSLQSITGMYRVTSKARLTYPIRNYQDRIAFAEAHPDRIELESWV